MLSCREVTETASDYLERDLGWWARLQFQMHLTMCRHCRRYMRQLRATIGLLCGIPVEPVPSETEESLLAKLREARAHAAAASSSGPSSLTASRTRE